MATVMELDELAQEVGGIGEFSGRPIYAERGDFLIHYLRNERAFARRLNSLFTIYLSRKDKRVVGYKIKGFRALVGRMGEFTIAIDHEDKSVTLLNVLEKALVGPEPEADRESMRDAVRELSEWAGHLDEMPAEAVGCP